MIVGVISDTHRIKKYIDIGKKYLENCNVIIHLGDNIDDIRELTSNFNGGVYGVQGNCDFTHEYPKENLIEIEGVKIFCTHGDLYGVKYGLNNIFYKAKELSANVVLFGHTHEHMLIEEEEILIMNPGSISLPRSNGRYIGFLDIQDGKIQDAYLKEIKIL